MDAVKSIVLVGCVIGIISTFFEFSLPKGEVRKGFGLLLGLVVSLVLITPFISGNIQLQNLKLENESMQEFYSDKIRENAQDLIMEKSQKDIEEYFIDKLNKNGIKAEEIKAQLKANSSDEIEIIKLEIKGARKDEEEKITALIREDLKQTKVEFS